MAHALARTLRQEGEQVCLKVSARPGEEASSLASGTAPSVGKQVLAGFTRVSRPAAQVLALSKAPETDPAHHATHRRLVQLISSKKSFKEPGFDNTCCGFPAHGPMPHVRAIFLFLIKPTSRQLYRYCR